MKVPSTGRKPGMVINAHFGIILERDLFVLVVDVAKQGAQLQLEVFEVLVF